MATNLKKLTDDEFTELLAVEGDTLPLYLLTAIEFKPPLPMPEKEIERRAHMDPDEEEFLPPYGTQANYSSVLVMLMKVDEPCLRVDGDGDTIYIFPNDPENGIDYALCNFVSNEHNAWAYRLNTRWWDPWDDQGGEYPLSQAYWYFKPDTIPDFDINRTETH